MWERIKDIYASAFLIGLAGWLLFHLVLIKLYGVVQIAQSNNWVIWVEIGMALGILFLGIERFIKCIRSSKRGKNG